MLWRIRPQIGGFAMWRKPGVRSKNGYWFSEAGDVGSYFGRVDVVSYSEAMARLWAALASEGGDRVLGFGVGGAVYANQRTNEDTPQVGRRSPALGVSSLVRRPATPDAMASTLNPPSLSTNTVAELRDYFLDWLRLHRSPALHRESQAASPTLLRGVWRASRRRHRREPSGGVPGRPTWCRTRSILR